VWFVHYRQQSERTRMHQGVLRDIASEQRDAKCSETGVCDLKVVRFRDPQSGSVYDPDNATTSTHTAQQ
jgi:hypothetical protein